jgi:hypothetical protein
VRELWILDTNFILIFWAKIPSSRKWSCDVKPSRDHRVMFFSSPASPGVTSHGYIHVMMDIFATNRLTIYVSSSHIQCDLWCSHLWPRKKPWYPYALRPSYCDAGQGQLHWACGIRNMAPKQDDYLWSLHIHILYTAMASRKRNPEKTRFYPSCLLRKTLLERGLFLGLWLPHLRTRSSNKGLTRLFEKPAKRYIRIPTRTPSKTSRLQLR